MFALIYLRLAALRATESLDLASYAEAVRLAQQYCLVDGPLRDLSWVIIDAAEKNLGQTCEQFMAGDVFARLPPLLLNAVSAGRDA